MYTLVKWSDKYLNGENLVKLVFFSSWYFVWNFKDETLIGKWRWKIDEIGSGSRQLLKTYITIIDCLREIARKMTHFIISWKRIWNIYYIWEIMKSTWYITYCHTNMRTFTPKQILAFLSKVKNPKPFCRISGLNVPENANKEWKYSIKCFTWSYRTKTNVTPWEACTALVLGN